MYINFVFHNRYSRKILWLEVCPTNKDSKVIAGFYLDAVKKYGKNTLSYSISIVYNQ